MKGGKNVSEVSNTLMVCIGLGTVFFGLISLVLLCFIMSSVCRFFVKDKPAETKPVNNQNNNQPIAGKQEIIAASCAVIAEELGTEANNIKVISFKRI